MVRSRGADARLTLGFVDFCSFVDFGRGGVPYFNLGFFLIYTIREKKAR